MATAIQTYPTFGEFINAANLQFKDKPTFVQEELAAIRADKSEENRALRLALQAVSVRPEMGFAKELQVQLFERFAEDWTRNEAQDLTYQPQLRQRPTEKKDAGQAPVASVKDVEETPTAPVVEQKQSTTCRDAMCTALTVGVVATAALAYYLKS